MSPLQFQKQIRLQEARRLMLVHRADAASIGFSVGYESASQFSGSTNMSLSVLKPTDPRAILRVRTENATP